MKTNLPQYWIVSLIALVAFGWFLKHSSVILPPVPLNPPAFQNQISEGTLHVAYFRGEQWPANYVNPYSDLLGGWVERIQTQIIDNKSDFEKYAFRSLYAAGALAIVLLLFPHILTAILFLSNLSFLSVLCSIRLSQGWDEFYINLRHAFNLAEYGLYSANRFEKLEATVDFLPFFGGAVLSKLLPFSLTDIVISIGLSGNIALVFLAYFATNHITRSVRASLVAASLMSIFPPLLYVAGTGFMAPFFTAHVFAGVYFSYLRKGKLTWLGHCLIGLLALTRTEAILFAFLLWTGDVLSRLKFLSYRSALKRVLALLLFKRGIFFALPFLLLTFFRKLYFGEMIPIPVTFKNTNGDFGYLRFGLEKLWTPLDSLEIGSTLLVFGAVIGFFGIQHFGTRRFAILFLSIFGFSISYFVGGGDWFPTTWNRYLIPFLVFYFLFLNMSIFFCSKHLTMILGRSTLSEFLRYPLYFMLITVLFFTLWRFEGFGRNDFTATWDDLVLNKPRWTRIEQLSLMGTHLQNTLPKEESIATTEQATLNYFAQKEIVDSLGISNLLVAKSPLNPLNPGNLVHRKRNTKVIEERLPGIIAPWGKVKMSPRVNNSPNEAHVILVTHHMAQMHVDIAYYRYGDYQNFLQLGYKPIMVDLMTHTFFYWVHPRLWNDHLKKMTESGINYLQDLPAPYKVSEDMTSRFQK